MRALLLLAVLLLAAAPVDAQRRPLAPRFGVGFDLALAPPGQDIVPEGLGIGLRGRVAIPINTDLSFAVDAGVDGFVINGQDDATYVFNPQASIILTLPRYGSARYLMGGFGGFIPLNDGDGFGDPSGGPTIHLGAGWAFPLNETSLYVELDPSLVIGETKATVVVPLRVGVIF